MPIVTSSRPLLPVVAVLLRACFMPFGVLSKLPALRARLQPGPRFDAREVSAKLAEPKESDCSDQPERHTLPPPIMLDSSSICSAGNSLMKREGMELVHWPYIRRFAAWKIVHFLRARVMAT